LLLVLSNMPAFGWARPVPIDPSRFRRGVSMGRGMAITAGAGPLSNLALAILGTLILGLAIRLQLGVATVAPFLLQIVTLNVVLALFNLIPIPPLDGSRVVAWLLPTRMAHQWHAVERFAPILLIVIFMYGGRLIRGPSGAVLSLLERLLTTIVGTPT
jgi:Zn-dependent protease